MGKDSTTALYNETTKSENFAEKTKTIKKVQTTKWPHAYECYARNYNLN